jgi:small subunit ribosomal protein S6e
MAEFKLVISNPKSGRSFQKEVKDDLAKALFGKKVGETFKGEVIDMPGYEFKLAGGSDNAGFPMRQDVSGSLRKKIVAFSGVGVHNKLRKPNPKKKGWRTMKGMRLKKTVAGNTVYDKTAQLNLVVVKRGKDPLAEGDTDEKQPKVSKAKKVEKKE